MHTVTPLWCAAVEGRLEALRVLAEAGADVNASSDSGSTPVRSACFMTHLDVVRFLVARGADIHRPNHNGGTCLINSVQSVRLCTFLLEHGAQVSEKRGLSENCCINEYSKYPDQGRHSVPIRIRYLIR